MLKRIHQILHHDDEPASKVQETTKTLDDTIFQLQQQLQQISDTLMQYNEKVRGLEDRQKTLQQRAETYYQKGNTKQAEATWETSKLITHQIHQYRGLEQVIENSRNRLLSKKAELEFNRDQLSAQAALGEIQADSSQLHATAMENLLLVQDNDEFALFNEQIAQAESKSQAIREITQAAPTDYVDSSEDQAANQKEIADSIQRKQLASCNSSLQQVKKKYQDFFNTEESTQSDPEVTKRKQRLNAFTEDTTHEKTQKVEHFFKEDSPPAVTLENNDRIKKFFGKA